MIKSIFYIIRSSFNDLIVVSFINIKISKNRYFNNVFIKLYVMYTDPVPNLSVGFLRFS